LVTSEPYRDFFASGRGAISALTVESLGIPSGEVKMDEHFKNELTMLRVLDAPLARVWQACRDTELLRQWWGMPNGVTMPFCTVDFRVGGELHFATQRPGNQPIWFNCIYRRIRECKQVVLEQHRSDESGTERDSPEWPASTIKLQFEDLNGTTRLKVVHAGMASERASVEDYRQGWSETLNRLAACLSHR
jgi:uncharacterized protein YndB with AHSA1/START domain